MIKLFISQPMNGKTNEEIQETRLKAINTARSLLGDNGGDVVEELDSFFVGAPHDANPLWFLGKALQLMSTADVVYFVKGWQDYRGCRLEHKACEEYNIKYVDE